MSKQLTEEQIQHLQEALRGHHLEALITLALATGLRRDELLSLRWQDVDLEKGEVHYQNRKTTNRESLPIPADVTEILKHHLAEQLRANVIWSEVVFPDATGVPLTARQLMQGWHSILEQAGLPRISFHNVRATVKQQALHLENQGKGE